nr:Gfo/Idh/MocA family oxidoreductase [Paenibacillus larvae]
MITNQVRWGILGGAGIAVSKVMPAIQQSSTGMITAIASRNEAKGRAIATQFGLPKAYGCYEDLLGDPQIDAVYVPLPNHLHQEWSIRALNAGKHVLCEKPAALNAREAAKMAEVAQKAGKVLSEAFMYRHHPRYQSIKDIIRSGKIGEIRGLRGAFTFNSTGAEDNVRFHRNMGGLSLRCGMLSHSYRPFFCWSRNRKPQRFTRSFLRIMITSI